MFSFYVGRSFYSSSTSIHFHYCYHSYQATATNSRSSWRPWTKAVDRNKPFPHFLYLWVNLWVIVTMNTIVASSARPLTSNGRRSGRTQHDRAAVCCCSRPASRLPPLPTGRSWLSWIWWRRVGCRAPAFELPEDSDSWWSAHPDRWRTITDKHMDTREG